MSAFSPEISARALIPKELLGQASSLHFSLQLHPEFVEVVLSEAAGGEIHWSQIFNLETIKDDFANAVNFVNDRNWHEKVFRKCTISFDTSEFCVVPKAFFTPEKAEELLSFHTERKTNKVESVEIPEIDAVLIFGVPDWSSQVIATFPNAKFLPSAFLYLKYSKAISSASTDTINVFHSPSSVVLCVFREHKLSLLNAYKANNEEDVLYHTSNSAMRLGIDFENAMLNVFEFNKGESLVNLMKHYNKRVRHLFPTSAEDKNSFYSNLLVLCA
jgi:Protein of unknown function (DUF3822)